MESYSDDDDARNAATAFAHRLIPIWQATLGSDLLGLYLIGSLAHAGFNRRYSDIDVALVTEAGLSPRQLDLLRGEAAALSPEWGPKVSLFWTDRQFGIGRFPPLDRIDYIDRPVVLMERERARPPRPTLEEIRQYLRGAPFNNWANLSGRFAAAAALEPRDRKAYLRTLLYPARFCLSYMTGAMTSNDAAVDYLRHHSPARLDVSLVERALQCRRDAADPDALFSARDLLPAQVDACAAILTAQ